MAINKKKLSDTLRPASFRGVSFQVESTEMGAGRRTQVHEYPQRDKPYAEDLGRAARNLSFSGYVVGADYVEQANRLIAALEQAGPGTLVHPWLGTFTVSLHEKANVSFSAALGVATFTLSFVESGELTFPAASTSTQAQSRIAATNLEAVSVAAFADRFNVKGFQDFVAAAASGNLGNMLGIVSDGRLGAMLGYANSVGTTLSTAIALVGNPQTLGLKIMGAFGLSGLTTAPASWTSLVRGLSRLGGGSALSAPVAPTVSTPSRLQAYQNAAAINALARQALIAQAVGASSLVGTAADTTMTAGNGVASGTTQQISHADMMVVRNELIAAIDQESLNVEDAVYQALMDARSAVWKDLTERARDNARIDTLTPPDVMPALVVAYDYYETAERDSDIVLRNNIRHPGFVPAAALKVLTR